MTRRVERRRALPPAVPRSGNHDQKIRYPGNSVPRGPCPCRTAPFAGVLGCKGRLCDQTSRAGLRTGQCAAARSHTRNKSPAPRWERFRPSSLRTPQSCRNRQVFPRTTRWTKRYGPRRTYDERYRETRRSLYVLAIAPLALIQTAQRPSRSGIRTRLERQRWYSRRSTREHQCRTCGRLFARSPSALLQRRRDH